MTHDQEENAMSQQNVTENAQKTEQDTSAQNDPAKKPAEGELKDGELDQVSGGGSLNIGGKDGITVKW